MLVELFRAVLAVVAAVAVATPAHGPLRGNRPLGDAVVGADMSWPNCPEGLGIPQRKTLGLPLPRSSARFVLIGLTNGPAFHPNPCLVSQVAFARERGLYASAYAVVTYPTRPQLRKYGAPAEGAPVGHSPLWNTGWAQAKVNLTQMRAAGLDSPAVWVDVEPVTEPAPWSHRPARNQRVVQGAVAGYRDSGMQVGLYSVRTLWRQVLGGARYGLPEWRSVGRRSPSAALRACDAGSFNGGPAVLAQWWDNRRDHDVLCPGPLSTDPLGHWFQSFADAS